MSINRDVIKSFVFLWLFGFNKSILKSPQRNITLLSFRFSYISVIFKLINVWCWCSIYTIYDDIFNFSHINFNRYTFHQVIYCSRHVAFHFASEVQHTGQHPLLFSWPCLHRTSHIPLIQKQHFYLKARSQILQWHWTSYQIASNTLGFCTKASTVEMY